jgi:tetratricopeptide (TPR) repeat protein
MTRWLPPACVCLPAALLWAGAVSFGQEVLRPFRTDPPKPPAEPEIRRAEPVRRATPVPAPIPAATPIPVAPAVPVEKKATPRPVPKATPLPVPEMGDPTGEIRITPSGSTMGPDQLQLYIADGYYGQGRFDMAAPEYEKYLNLYPGGAGRQTALFRLAESYRRAGSLNAARSSYQALLEQFGTGEFIGPAAYRVAELYYGDRNYAAALPYYRKASVRLADPKLANAAKFFAGRCLEAQGQKMDARMIYEDLVATPKDNPFLDNSRLALATLLRDANRTAEALKQVQALAQLTENPELKAQATVYAGLWQIDLGQNAKAEETLNEALKMESVARWRDVAQSGLVQLAFNGEKYQQVIDTWTTGEKDFGPESRPQVMLLVAKAYAALGKSEESQQFFNRVVQEFPTSVYAKEAGYERIRALYKNNDPNLLTEIDAYLNAGVEEQKKDLIFLMKAEVLFKKNDFAAAAPLYEYATKSRQLTGQLKADALSKLAWCHQQTGALPNAVKVLGEIIDGFPTYKGLAAAVLQRAVTRLRLQDQDGAVKDFKKLIDQFPKAKEREAALLQLARMLGQRGDNTGMADTFKIYLRDFPQAAEADRAEASFWIGSVAFENKAYKDAIEPLRAARQLNKEEYFERASLRLMLCSYYLEDTDGVAKEIEEYTSGGAKGQVPYEVLRWLGITLHERARAAAAAGSREKAVEDNKGAIKYLSLLMQREDAKAEDWKPLGESCLALKDYTGAERAFHALLAALKEPATRAFAYNQLAQAQLGAQKFSEARDSVEQGLKLQPDGEINAELRITSGDILATQQNWLEAAKTYESVSVVIDDEAITPRAGEKAVEAYRKAGAEAIAGKLLNKLQSRYPEYFQGKKLSAQ